MEVTILDLTFDVIIDSATPFDPGVSFGPAESCYPPEGGEIEWHVDENYPGVEFIQAAMDSNENWYSDIEDQIMEDLNEEPEPPEPPEPWND